jgi:predicted membrane protein
MHNLKRANASALLQKRAMMITKNLGMLLLAIYLILVGITSLFHVAIPAIVIGILALAAGILILIGR